MNFERSREQFKKTRKIIPLASQTFSKSYLQFIEEQAPLFIERGKGAYVWDIDGNKYIDMINGLLPVILGYNYPAVDNAIKKQLKKGIVFSLASKLEYQLAKKLKEIIPCCQMVRFGKNGSDATAGTVRLARAITKKDHIFVFGYHGWQDWCVGLNPRNEGVPKCVKNLVHKFEYNNIDSLKNLFEKYKNKVAAVIMEPVTDELPRDNFLKKVKDLTHKNKALLIFDEIITGFRLDLGGAQKYFGVAPDLATFGKSMANGMPISVVCGRAEYMKKMEDIFYSFTFGGECLSLAASLACIEELEKKKVIRHIWLEGERLIKEVGKIIKENKLEKIIEIKGMPCWHKLKISSFENYSDLEIKSFIQQELLKKGILWTGSHNMSFSHKRKEINKVILAYKEILRELKETLDKKDLKKRLLAKPIKGNYSVR